MKVISSMATRHLLAELAEAAVVRGLPALEVESVGGVDAARRVRDGEEFDVVVLADDAVAALASEGHVDAATLTPIATSQVAVARASASGEPAVDPGVVAFADAAELREALLAAKRIGYSTGPSGAALVAMIASWGLVNELGPRLVQASPGVPVARLVADGEVDLGFQQLSELVGQQGVQILGVMPADCAVTTVFGGAVAATAADAAGARAVLEFLGSPGVAPLIERHSFEATMVPRASRSVATATD